jgi:hypothetical protein
MEWWSNGVMDYEKMVKEYVFLPVLQYSNTPLLQG